MKVFPVLLSAFLLSLGASAQLQTTPRLSPEGPVLKISASGLLPPFATARIGLELPQSDRTSVEVSTGLVLYDYTQYEKLNPSPELRLSWYKYNNWKGKKNPSRVGFMYAFRTITYMDSHRPYIDTATHWSSTEPSFQRIDDDYRVWHFHQQFFFYTGKKYQVGSMQLDVDLGAGVQLISTQYIGHQASQLNTEGWNLGLDEFPLPDEEGVEGQFAFFLDVKFGKVMKPIRPPH